MAVDASAPAHIVDLPGPEATEQLGRSLAPLLRPRDVIALRGDLGAGKTTLARGLIRALTGEAELPVPSPTFTLVEVYDTRAGALWHFDLYRLKGPEEAWELGIEQAFSEAISLIEWPERLGASLPALRLDLELATAGVGRRARLSGGGGWPQRLAQLGVG